jgi:hypothetical protein
MHRLGPRRAFDKSERGRFVGDQKYRLVKAGGDQRSPGVLGEL